MPPAASSASSAAQRCMIFLSLCRRRMYAAISRKAAGVKKEPEAMMPMTATSQSERR